MKRPFAGQIRLAADTSSLLPFVTGQTPSLPGGYAGLQLNLPSSQWIIGLGAGRSGTGVNLFTFAGGK